MTLTREEIEEAQWLDARPTRERPTRARLINHPAVSDGRKAVDKMHYKNGREAKNGDKVMLLPSYGAPVVGVLYDAQAGNDYCNGKIASTSPGDPTPNLKDCLHLDDVRAAIGESTVCAPSTSEKFQRVYAALLANDNEAEREFADIAKSQGKTPLGDATRALVAALAQIKATRAPLPSEAAGVAAEEDVKARPPAGSVFSRVD